jgi:hypothetical protein
MSEKRKPFLWIVTLFAAILLLLSFWVIGQKSLKPSESLMIYNVVISPEVNDRLRLTGAVSRFPHGSRQMCLRFDYNKAMEEGVARILWFREDKLVQSDKYELPEMSGSKVYCLLKEDGQPLPKGAYSIVILNGEERLSDFRFEIY